MRIVTFESDGVTRPGIITSFGEEEVVDLSPLIDRRPNHGQPTRSSLVHLLDRWQEIAEELEESSSEPDSLADLLGGDVVSHALDEIQLQAPIQRPTKLTCVGLNYHDHAQEANIEVPREPLLFGKQVTSIIGPGEAIRIPGSSREIDYEAELALVIGGHGFCVTEDEASRLIAGYTCFNDVTARDWQARSSQWIASKSFPTFGPLGPWIVSAAEIEDPSSLDIALRVNGETMQQGNTGNMIFSPAEIVSYVSQIWPLEPGDVICTGTPAGVGFTRTPSVFLRDGDVVEVEISRIGTLRNPVTEAVVDPRISDGLHSNVDDRKVAS